MTLTPEQQDASVTVVPSGSGTQHGNTMTAMVEGMDQADYHADPCAIPALSSSIANLIVTESPLHAWHRHPRLGGRPPVQSSEFDRGSLVHALLLGDGKDIELIDADNWRTKAAREARDAAREAGKLAVLEREYHETSRVTEILREKLASMREPIVFDGQSETAVFWEETATNGNPVQCRGMIDHLKLPWILDLKTIHSANPLVCQRHIDRYGYAIQQAAYTSAIGKNLPELLGRTRFVFVFVELQEPYSVVPIELDGEFQELGRRRWRRAVDRWEECLRTDHWPSYTEGLMRLAAPAWAIKQEMDQEMAAALSGGDPEWMAEEGEQ